MNTNTNMQIWLKDEDAMGIETENQNTTDAELPNTGTGSPIRTAQMNNGVTRTEPYQQRERQHQKRLKTYSGKTLITLPPRRL
jgi:hypothetical protein